MDNLQKEMAVRCLERLGVYKPYITAFKKKGTVTVFEEFIGYYVGEYGQYPELQEKINEVEQEWGCLVYAVIHSRFKDYGTDVDMYSMLIIPKHYESENECTLISRFDSHNVLVLAEVWNKTWDEVEAGDVGVQAAFGGIRRSF